MSLGLDLSASDEKVRRARTHLEAIRREIPAVLDQRQPYSWRIGKIDRESGWCSLYMTRRKSAELALCVIVGDLIHNLRCALDYIVTALADASEATVTHKHQFPICFDEASYNRRVGTKMSVKRDGDLGGIKYGMAEIWDLQPFNLAPSPKSALFLLNYFSNADKHRVITGYLSRPEGGTGQLVHDGQALDQVAIPMPDEREAGLEFEVARYQFAKPYPTKMHFETEMDVTIYFTAPAFGNEPLPYAITAEVLGDLCDYVTMVTDLFKRL